MKIYSKKTDKPLDPSLYTQTEWKVETMQDDCIVYADEEMVIEVGDNCTIIAPSKCTITAGKNSIIRAGKMCFITVGANSDVIWMPPCSVREI